MNSYQESLQKLMSDLKRQRDELALQIHLGEMDAKEEFKRLSGRIDELSRQYEPVKDAVGETSENVFSALKLAAEEVQHGLGRVWKAVRGK